VLPSTGLRLCVAEGVPTAIIEACRGLEQERLGTLSSPAANFIDLDRSTEEILAESEAFCRAQPGFRRVEEWRAAMAERIAAHDRA
jgi:hypothetical protein